MGLHEEAGTHRRGGPVCPTSVDNPLVHEQEGVKVIIYHTFVYYFACYVGGLQRTLAYLPARTSNMRILTPIGKRCT